MTPSRFLIASIAIVAACRDTGPQWVTVVRDANYVIAIDTAHVSPMKVAHFGRWLPVYDVWYRTDHAAPRMHDGKPFDRETVQSLIQCDSMWFKVRSVDMALRDDKVVARQRTTDDELYAQRWRAVERGTSEEMAALAACHYGRSRAIPPSRASR